MTNDQRTEPSLFVLLSAVVSAAGILFMLELSGCHQEPVHSTKVAVHSSAKA